MRRGWQVQNSWQQRARLFEVALRPIFRGGRGGHADRDHPGQYRAVRLAVESLDARVGKIELSGLDGLKVSGSSDIAR